MGTLCESILLLRQYKGNLDSWGVCSPANWSVAKLRFWTNEAEFEQIPSCLVMFGQQN